HAPAERAGGGCSWVEHRGLACCWVLREQAPTPASGSHLRAGGGVGGVLSLTVGRLLPAAHLLWCVARGWSVGCLRTVQWTRASLIFCGQVIKSIRWMPWH